MYTVECCIIDISQSFTKIFAFMRFNKLINTNLYHYNVRKLEIAISGLNFELLTLSLTTALLINSQSFVCICI